MKPEWRELMEIRLALVRLAVYLIHGGQDSKQMAMHRIRRAVSVLDQIERRVLTEPPCPIF